MVLKAVELYWFGGRAKAFECALSWPLAKNQAIAEQKEPRSLANFKAGQPGKF